VKQVGEQLGALNQPRARARERSSRIDGPDAIGPERFNMRGSQLHFRDSLLCIPAARHGDYDVWAGRGKLCPLCRA
jgi:hypothetical protein